MRYMLLLHVQESGWGELSDEQRAAGMATYDAYSADLARAGAFIMTSPLAPSAGARSITTKGGRIVTMDGPYAETKEQVAGFYVIEVPDEAAALDWARKCPAAGHGTVEVRALRER